MADSLNSIGSIAVYLNSSFINVPAAISGTLIQLVDIARQDVANYTGQSIGSNSIADTYQPAIVNLSKAAILNLLGADQSTATISLAELTIGKTDKILSAQQYKMLAEMSLKSLGRYTQYAKSLS